MNELQILQNIARRLGIPPTLHSTSTSDVTTLFLSLGDVDLVCASENGEITSLSLADNPPKEEDGGEDNDMSVEQIIGAVTR